MNISSSVGQTAKFGQGPTANVGTNHPNAPIKKSVRSVDPAAISEFEQAQSSKKQATSSIVIDEQAIALFEQNQVEQNQASLSTHPQASKERFSSAGQDQPSAKNETAVANYQAVGNLAQRESVQKLFGVDLFA